MGPTSSTPPSSTLDAAEVSRFARFSGEWWDPYGSFRQLHQLGPARLTFIRDCVTRHFKRDAGVPQPLAGLTVVDVGCGGGLISEPLARMGGRVTAIDPAKENIEAARGHAEPQGLDITYRAARTEDLLDEGASFDVVVCLEVVEHVPDAQAFLNTCGRVMGPGGLIILSTLNRTLKAYALAIVGAEYVLRWLPAGTHQWDRFVTPEELSRYMANAGLSPIEFRGLVYNPFTDRWSLSADTDVNYLAAAAKPAH
jgi:2-polyprenyl-6-hydroxyphenyl methylase / 3-demethylubiquinone-9 3-methyltransferase